MAKERVTSKGGVVQSGRIRGGGKGGAEPGCAQGGRIGLGWTRSYYACVVSRLRHKAITVAALKPTCTTCM